MEEEVGDSGSEYRQPQPETIREPEVASVRCDIPARNGRLGRKKMNEGVFEESKEGAYRRSMGGLDQVFPHVRERDITGGGKYCARNN